MLYRLDTVDIEVPSVFDCHSATLLVGVPIMREDSVRVKLPRKLGKVVCGAGGSEGPLRLGFETALLLPPRVLTRKHVAKDLFVLILPRPAVLALLVQRLKDLSDAPLALILLVVGLRGS